MDSNLTSEPGTEAGSEVTLPESDQLESDLNGPNTPNDQDLDDRGDMKLDIEVPPEYLNERRKSSKYSTGDTIALRKRYGLFSCVAVIICNVIGSGIFINPQDVYAKTESTGISLLIWFGMGIHVTVGALCYAELGTTLPLSGGDYAYLSESFGPFAGFQYQWAANLLFIPAVNAILARTVGQYFLQLICIFACNSEGSIRDGMEILYGKGSVIWYASLIGFFLVVLITVVNCLSLKFAERMQNILMIAKLSACFMVFILGVVQISRDGFQSKLSLSLREEYGFEKHAFDIASAIYEVSFSYLGWTYLNLITEELENPHRNLPIAIIVSMPLITVIYVSMNICYFAALNNDQLRQTVGIASDTLNAVVGNGLRRQVGWIAPIIIMISAFGGLAAHMMASSRVTFVGARQKQLPTMLGLMHMHRLTPIPALIFQGIMTTVFLAAQNVVTIILMSVYAENFFSSLAVVALLYLRWKKPEMDRPIKLFIGIPIFFTAISVIIFIIPILGIFVDRNGEAGLPVSEIVVVIGPIVLFLLGIPAYIYFIQHPPFMNRWPTWLYSPNCQQNLDHKMAKALEKPLHLNATEDLDAEPTEE